MTIARGSGVSVWRQIQQELADEITRGAIKPGHQLPTEDTLATRFAVNRHTLRRAVAALRDAGLVRIEQGRGTFVEEDVVPYVIGRRTRFSENVASLKRQPGGRLIRAVERPADAAIASALKVRRDRPVITLSILREVDDRPLAFATHHFPANRFAGIDALFRQTKSLTAALARMGVADYFRRSTRVTTRLPTADEARLLQQPANTPVLVTENINVDNEGTTIDYTIVVYAGQRVELVVDT